MKISKNIFNTNATEEKNAENFLMIIYMTLPEEYIENWQDHAGSSEAGSTSDEGREISLG